jgi:hypothetical protein
VQPSGSASGYPAPVGVPSAYPASSASP